MDKKIQAAVEQRNDMAAASNTGAKQTLVTMMNSMLDSEGYRKRFEDLLGKRTPQFVSSLVSMVNGTKELKEAFANAPITVIQSALKAASFDLPIDPTLGYAYIVPFRNNKKGGIYEAQFILGYKGMLQLAMRTGAYRKINVLDIREGELIHYDRLTEDVEFNFIEDEAEREGKPIIGYVGYFRLKNGMEKTIYMTVQQIDAHEKKNRKGPYPSKGWRDDRHAMEQKTVLRRLIGKWGLMSIDYQDASPVAIRAASAIEQGRLDDDDVIPGEIVQDEPGDGDTSGGDDDVVLPFDDPDLLGRPQE